MCTMGSDEPRAEKQFRMFWKWRLNNAPEFATSIGIHEYDNRLDEMSMASYLRRKDTAQSILQTIQRYETENKDQLPADVKLNLGLVTSDLKQFVETLHFKPYLMPVNLLEGPQSDFPRLLSWMKTDTPSDVSLIITRMRLFKQQIDETIALLEEGIRLGIVMHKVSVETLPSVFKNMAEDETEKSPVFKPFIKKPDTVSVEEWEKLVKEAKEVIEQSVKPAYLKLSKFLHDVYVAATRPSISASSLPNGAAYYAACLKFHTTTDLTPQEVHDIGVREVARITEGMVGVKEQVGYQGTLEEFRAYMSTDDKYKYSSAEDIVSHYNTITKNIEAKLPDYFEVLPKCPYEVTPVPPEFAPTFPGAYYLAPPHDGSRPGTFYINTYKPETRKRYDALALALHEAVPGHHLNACLAMETGSSPDFRRFMEDRKYYEPPARFSMNTGYVEGWGLYSEYLGEEMGLYSDPYDMFGRLSMEMMRACRLVVDTGMHSLGWSREDAIEYVMKNTASDLHEVTAEIDRYITWPGQACGYKIGELRIKILRKKAEEELGSKFDLKKFHHLVAAMGGVPLNVLEQQVDGFIQQHLAR